MQNIICGKDTVAFFNSFINLFNEAVKKNETSKIPGSQLVSIHDFGVWNSFQGNEQ